MRQFQCTLNGAARRYGPRGGVDKDGNDNAKAYAQIERELVIIDELNFPG